MEELTPALVQALTTLFRAQATAGERSSKAVATVSLSRSVPSMSIVKSFEPTETPSMPTLINSSISITLTGSSTIIQNLNVGLENNPSAATNRLTFVSSWGERTKGIISQRFLYFSLTFLMAVISRVKTSGLLMYLKAPRKPSIGLGSSGSQYFPPGRARYSFVLKSVAR